MDGKRKEMKRKIPESWFRMRKILSKLKFINKKINQKTSYIQSILFFQTRYFHFSKINPVNGSWFIFLSRGTIPSFSFQKIQKIEFRKLQKKAIIQGPNLFGEQFQFFHCDVCLFKLNTTNFYFWSPLLFSLLGFSVPFIFTHFSPFENQWKLNSTKQEIIYSIMSLRSSLVEQGDS